MREIPNYISGFEKIVDAYGYWPGFHDSPVLSFKRTPDGIEFRVEAWEMGSEADSSGYFILSKRHEIGFSFSGIGFTELDGFLVGNILFELVFSPVALYESEGQFQVELDSAMGGELSGKFSARSGSVSFIRPVSGESEVSVV